MIKKSYPAVSAFKQWDIPCKFNDDLERKAILLLLPIWAVCLPYFLFSYFQLTVWWDILIIFGLLCTFEKLICLLNYKFVFTDTSVKVPLVEGSISYDQIIGFYRERLYPNVIHVRYQRRTRPIWSKGSLMQVTEMFSTYDAETADQLWREIEARLPNQKCERVDWTYIAGDYNPV